MIGKYFIDTGTIRQAETVSQDERVGRVVAVHPDSREAEARAASFRLLNITRVYVRNIPITTGGDS